MALWLPSCTAATDESVVGHPSPFFMDFHLLKGFIQPMLENCMFCFWHFADCYERCSEGLPVFCLPDFLADGSNNAAFRYRLSWSKIIRLCGLRRKYVQLYASCLQQSFKVDNQEIKDMEKELDFDVILLWRFASCFHMSGCFVILATEFGPN